MKRCTHIIASTTLESGLSSNIQETRVAYRLEVLHVNKITLSVSMHHGSNQEYTREYPTVTVAVVV